MPRFCLPFALPSAEYPERRVPSQPLEAWDVSQVRHARCASLLRTMLCRVQATFYKRSPSTNPSRHGMSRASDAPPLILSTGKRRTRRPRFCLPFALQCSPFTNAYPTNPLGVGRRRRTHTLASLLLTIRFAECRDLPTRMPSTNPSRRGMSREVTALTLRTRRLSSSLPHHRHRITPPCLLTLSLFPLRSAPRLPSLTRSPLLPSDSTGRRTRSNAPTL